MKINKWIYIYIYNLKLRNSLKDWVTTITEKMKYGYFKRFGYMHRRVINVQMRSDKLIQVEKTKNDRQ